MGTGGTVSGDPVPGTRATVQSFTMGQIDRDWRYIGIVLPADVLSFTGVHQLTAVQLNWLITSQVAIANFEIERSTDNRLFTAAGSVTAAMSLNEPVQFSFTDTDPAAAGSIVYYRLKINAVNGVVKYSNVIAVKNTLQQKDELRVSPNPANNQALLHFYADNESAVTIRMINAHGKTVLLQQRNAVKGMNDMPLQNLAAFGNGVYTLQLVFPNRMAVSRLVILK
jgi:Secretion system C-terminal sorting domain